MSIIKLIKGFMAASKGAIVGMPEAQATDDPFILFEKWFNEAKQAGLFLPESMALATATKTGEVSNRMVLLKSFDSSGFVFYTNYHSQKAKQITQNPQCALLFHWDLLQRQVRIEGNIEKVTPAESNQYFQSRPKGSQLGAWASKQSQGVPDRQTMEADFAHIKQRFKQNIPTPDFWGGYRVKPKRLEFWQGRVNRFHDRMVFTQQQDQNQWQSERLYP